MAELALSNNHSLTHSLTHSPESTSTFFLQSIIGKSRLIMPR